MTFLDRDFAEWTADPAFEACTHPEGRAFPNPLVREFLRALGIVTCPMCGRESEPMTERRPDGWTWGDMGYPRPESIPRDMPDRKTADETLLVGPRGEPLLIRKPRPFGFHPRETK